MLAGIVDLEFWCLRFLRHEWRNRQRQNQDPRKHISHLSPEGSRFHLGSDIGTPCSFWRSFVFLENESRCDCCGWNVVMIPVESLFGMTDPAFPDNVLV